MSQELNGFCGAQLNRKARKAVRISLEDAARRKAVESPD